MTLRRLIEALEDLAAEHGDNAEVRLAFQPSWPFEHSIGEIAANADEDADDEPDDMDDDAGPEDDDEPEHEDYPGQRVVGPETGKPAVIYIGEGAQIGYLPGNASRALGWR
jgi:hypothetical protein